jgi:hypothetical protein
MCEFLSANFKVHSGIFRFFLSFKMSYGGGQKVQKVMVQPINLIFRSRDATFDILRNDAPPPPSAMRHYSVLTNPFAFFLLV